MAESTPRHAAETINKIGGFQADVDDQGVVRVKYRGQRRQRQQQAEPRRPSPQQAEPRRLSPQEAERIFQQSDQYPIGNTRGAQAAMGPQDNERYQWELQKRLAQLEEDRTALRQQALRLTELPARRTPSRSMQYIKTALDSLEQEELWTQDELYRSGYVPPEATDITSHVLQYGAGQQLGLIPNE